MSVREIEVIAKLKVTVGEGIDNDTITDVIADRVMDSPARKYADQFEIVVQGAILGIAKEDAVSIVISTEGAKSFVSDSAGWGAMGYQEIQEAIVAVLDARGIKPPYTPKTKGREQ